jgi:hypothetical protein
MSYIRLIVADFERDLDRVRFVSRIICWARAMRSRATNCSGERSATCLIE